MGVLCLQTAIKDTREPRDPITTEYHPSAAHQPQVTATNTLQHQNSRRDAVVPSLDGLRSNPTLTQAVSQILSTYEGQARLDAGQGKASNTQCSGRFNATDIVTTPPELRWANEGFHGVKGRNASYMTTLPSPSRLWVN